jgi:hypothetical protein
MDTNTQPTIWEIPDYAWRMAPHRADPQRVLSCQAQGLAPSGG